MYNYRKICDNCQLIDDYKEFDNVCETCFHKGLKLSEHCAENFIDIHHKNKEALHEIEELYFKLKHEVAKFERSWDQSWNTTGTTYPTFEEPKDVVG